MSFNPDKPTAVVVLGVSRSGKDTIADYLDAEWGFEITHMLSDFYEFLEEHFDLPSDSIRDGRSKNLVLTEGGKTLSDFLVSFFHAAKDSGINWTAPFMEKETASLITDTVFTGVRNLHEARPLIINQFGNDAEGKHFLRYNVVVLSVTRPGFEGYSSDENLNSLIEYFKSTCTHFFDISNDGTLADLYFKIDKIMEDFNL